MSFFLGLVQALGLGLGLPMVRDELYRWLLAGALSLLPIAVSFVGEIAPLPWLAGIGVGIIGILAFIIITLPALHG